MVGSGFYVHKMHVTIYVAISNTPLPTRTVSQVITVCISVIYIIYERSISFLTILKLFGFSGFQTKMVFKQSFKYLKNEKLNLLKLF